MSRKTRKLIWSAPLVAVLAVAGALAMFVMLAPNGAQAHDLPGAVMNLKAEGINQHEIKITWDAPATGAVTGYRIDVSEDQFTWVSLVMDTGNTMTEYTHGDLSAGDERFYRVFALNSAGAGPSPVGDTTDNDLYVHGFTLASATPGQVRSLSARGVSDEQIDLTWAEPSMTGGGIERYCIAVATQREFLLDPATNPTVQVAAANCNAGMALTDADALATLNTTLNGATATNPTGGRLVIDGKDTAYMHKGLDSELTLYYRAYAGNTAGVSTTVTNVASAKTSKSPTPGQPKGLKPVSTGSAVDLYWNWPAGQLDIGREEFEIQMKSNTLNRWSAAIDVTAGTFPAQFSGHNPADVPGPADDGAANDYTGAGTTRVDYQVRVDLDDGTTGPWSSTASISWPLSTAAALPGVEEPTNTGDDADLSAEAMLNSIKLSWTREGEADEPKPSGYVIDAIKGTGGTAANQKFAFSSLQTNTTYTSETYTHPRLKPGEMWYYRAFPYSSGSKLYGSPLTLQTMTMAAMQPDQLECAQLTTAGDGPTRIMLSWGMVSEDGGTPITGYHVQVSANGGTGSTIDDNATWTNAPDSPVAAPMRTYTYDPEGSDALEAEDSRWFRVIVLNSVITDSDGKINAAADTNTDLVDDSIDLSAVCAFRGATDAAGSPGTPDGLVAEPARDAGGIDPDNPIPDSERGVLLLWNQPDNPAGDTVTGYNIARRTRENATADWSAWDTDWAEIDASKTSHTDETKVAMLLSGEARQYRVSAKSGAGTGMHAEVTYPHAEATHAPVSTVLTAPTNVTATDPGTDPNNLTINVTWTDGENADGGHIVMLFTDDFTGVTINVPAEGETSSTFSNVAMGSYVAVVVSIKSRTEYLYAYDTISVGQ